jgi:hypothetical protein
LARLPQFPTPEMPMCDQCDPFDEKITRYRFMMRWINDERARKEFLLLIAKCEAQKRELHPVCDK